jgi:large subunit ribosomal protein L32e
MTKNDTIKEFTRLPGIGKAKAELLYNNGFTSLQKLKTTSIEDLIKIKGITEKNATDILGQLKEEPIKTKGKKKEPSQTAETKLKEEKKKKPEEQEVVIEEEKEEGYQVKKKPTLDAQEKNQLKVRKQIKQRTPQFLREEWFRYKRIPENWRQPDGIDSKMRKNLKYRPSKVRVGFRGPRQVRGRHSSGFKEVMVHNVSELDHVDPKKQAVRIGGTVGTRKRLEIVKRADELEIRILNVSG